MPSAMAWTLTTKSATSKRSTVAPRSPPSRSLRRRTSTTGKQPRCVGSTPAWHQAGATREHRRDRTVWRYGLGWRDGESGTKGPRAPATGCEPARRRDKPTPGWQAVWQPSSRFQHARFNRDYADLLANERYRAATQFFLEDLYSPADFADRDTQFGRVVPAMARVFPADVMHTVAQLAELHALTESLDQEMAQQVTANAAVDDASYRGAWRAVGAKRGAAAPA